MMGSNQWGKAWLMSFTLHLLLVIAVGWLTMNGVARSGKMAEMVELELATGGGGGGGGGGVGDGVGGGGGGGGGGNSGGVIEGFNDKFGGSIKLPQPPSEAGGDSGAKDTGSPGDAGSTEKAAAGENADIEFVSLLAAGGSRAAAAGADGKAVSEAVKKVMDAAADAADRDKLPVPELDFDIGSGIGAGSGGGVGDGTGTGIGSGDGSGIGEGSGSGIGDGSGSGIGSGAGSGIDSGTGSGIGSGSGSGIGAGSGTGIGSGSGSGIGHGSGSGIGAGSGSGVGSGSGSGIGAGNLQAPSILQQVKPRYPEEARQAGIEGTVVLRIQILTNGDPGEISVLRSSGSASLDEAAVDAVGEWRFVPAKDPATGRSIACYTSIPIVFRLR